MKTDVMRKAQWGFLIFLGLVATQCKKPSGTADSGAVPASTTVTSADLKMRIAPNTTAVEIGRLVRGEQVKIVQRSVETVQIGKYDAHWYKVTNSTGLTGWVYGAHLAVESDEGDARAVALEAEKKLKTALMGRWDVAKTNGSLTGYFVTLTTAGDIEFGYGKKASQYGKYTVTFADSSAAVQMTEVEKPMMTDLKAKFIGETLVFTCMMNGTEYKLNLAEKDPELFRDLEKKKAQTPAPGSPAP